MSENINNTPYERFLNPKGRTVPEIDYDLVTGECESTLVETKKEIPPSCQNCRWVGCRSYGWDKGACSKHIPD